MVKSIATLCVGLHVVSTLRESLLISNFLTPVLEQFFQMYLLPELLSRNLESGAIPEQPPSMPSSSAVLQTMPDITNVIPPTIPVHVSTDVYCLCQQEEHGLMIACDGENCPFQWFHYACVGIKRKPKGQWFCQDCKKHRKS